jgi:alkyl hydroperoxide reductase subunit D
MTFDTLLERIPDYAKDLRLNLSSVLRQTELTPQQLWGTVAASAIASRNRQVIDVLLREAEGQMSPVALAAAKTAAAVMGMNNVYYRFLHLTSNANYRTIPARLRMNGIRNHGVEQVDFELWCTAVSAINACGACVDSHEHVLREKGVTEAAVLAAIRIASVIHAVAVVFDTEAVAAESAQTA